MFKMNKAVVYKGRASEIAVCFVDQDCNNLHTCGITGSFLRIENQDGSFIEKAASSGIAWGAPESTYMYIYPFTAEETALFKLGVDLSVYLKIVFGANSMKYEFKKFLLVMNDVF